MKGKKRHYIALIIFFSMLIVAISGLFLLLTKQQGEERRINKMDTVSSLTLHDLQVIHNASTSGTVICSTQDPNKCDGYGENTVLEYDVGCNGSESSSSIYICKNQGSSGKWWTYVSWTRHGRCHFCLK